MGEGKRRSDRVRLTIPLRLHATDAQDVEFWTEGRTLVLNRHGARIEIGRGLVSGSTVRIVNVTNRHEADFRVVGPTAPRTDKNSEWGVELINLNENIWGIQFPPPLGDDAYSAALLECRKCHVVALAHLSQVEVEVLDTAGIITRFCDNCQTQCAWGYAEQRMATEDTKLTEGRAAAEADGIDKRRYRRAALQLPVRVRDYQGGVEITKTDNVSKGGFCFVSERNYLLGVGVMVACPYSPTDQSPELHASIVRIRRIEGSPRKIYGVRYDLLDTAKRMGNSKS